jgi:hypothetical protein
MIFPAASKATKAIVSNRQQNFWQFNGGLKAGVAIKQQIEQRLDRSTPAP